MSEFPMRIPESRGRSGGFDRATGCAVGATPWPPLRASTEEGVQVARPFNARREREVLEERSVAVLVRHSAWAACTCGGLGAMR